MHVEKIINKSILENQLSHDRKLIPTLLLMSGFFLLIYYPVYVAGLCIIGFFGSYYLIETESKFTNFHKILNFFMLIITSAEVIKKLFFESNAFEMQSNLLIVCCLIFSISAFFLIYSIAGTLSQLIKWKFNYIIFPFCLAILAFVYPALIEDFSLPIRLSIKLSMFLCFRSIWFFCTEIQDSNSYNRKFLFSNMIQPFWNFGVIPFSHEAAKNKLEYKKTVFSGLLILISSLLIKQILDILLVSKEKNIFLNALLSFRILNANFSSESSLFIFYRSSFFQTLDKWLIVMGGFLLHLFHVISVTGVYVGTARLCGIKLFRYIYKPFYSRTLYECLTRYNYFYVNLISKLLLNPLSMSLRFIRDFKIRLSVATFISIFFIGLYYHFFRWHFVVAKDGLEYLERFVGYYIYFFMIAFSAGASVYASLAWPNSWFSRLHFAIRNAIYFVYYSVLLSLLGTDYVFVPSSEHLYFVRSLFDWF